MSRQQAVTKTYLKQLHKDMMYGNNTNHLIPDSITAADHLLIKEKELGLLLKMRD